MLVEFINKDLEELYKTGHSRKYRQVQQDTVKKMPRVVKMLEQAERIQNLWNYKSLNFEGLQGTDRFSVRVDIRWRLEMKIEWTDKDCTIGIIGLTDLTNHYRR